LLNRVDYHATARQYSAMAAHYDDWAADGWRGIVDKQGAHLDALLKRNGFGGACSVLNITCGRGTQLFGLAALGHGCTGLDLSDGQLALARAAAKHLPRGETITWVAGDAVQASRHVDAHFDCVISFGNSLPLLGALENIRAALDEACTLMKPGGLLVLTGMDYTSRRVERPHIIQSGPIAGGRGVWMETAEWAHEAQYVSHLTFAYTAPEFGVKHYPFPLLYALTAAELQGLLEAGGFENIVIKSREDLKMRDFYQCTARKQKT
jgi:SAM-dependent methyltransferase